MNFRFVRKWLQPRRGSKQADPVSASPPPSGSWLPAMGGASLLLVLWWLGVMNALEPLGQRLLFQLRGTQAWDERIVLIKIDQESLDALGWFPWRRDRYAQLLQVLAQASPNTVAFDIIFSEAAADDAALADAMFKHGQVVLATAWHDNRQPWLPTTRLSDAAIATGHITAVTADQPTLGYNRTVTLPQIQGYPALALAAAQVHQLSDPTFQIPAGSDPLHPNWPGPIAQLEQYSFVDVLNQRIPPQVFENKIILVGMTAQGMDPFQTPFERTGPSSGVNLHATLLHNVLQQNLLYLLPRWVWLLPLGGWFLFCRYGLTRFAMVRQGILLLAGGLTWIVVSVVALAFNYSLPIAMPLCLLGGTGLSSLLSQYKKLDRANQQLHNKAAVDETTQIKNRLFFNEYSAFIWRQTMREIHPLSLILCDVDHFKLYNDTYGHPAGDQCLYQVAQTLQTCLYRKSDLVARYGGEEFIILLPTTDLAGAISVAEKIRAKLSEQAIPHRGSLTSDKVTLSLGIASVRPSMEFSLEQLIEQADQALYQAKRQGRDRYCTA